MFSVPLSMAILAPAERANHSSGTPIFSARSSAARIRRHSGSASEPIAPIGSPRRTTRVIPSGILAVKFVRSPTTMFDRFLPGGRETGTRTFCASRSHSWNSPGREVGVGSRPSAA